MGISVDSENEIEYKRRDTSIQRMKLAGALTGGAIMLGGL